MKLYILETTYGHVKKENGKYYIESDDADYSRLDDNYKKNLKDIVKDLYEYYFKYLNADYDYMHLDNDHSLVFRVLKVDWFGSGTLNNDEIAEIGESATDDCVIDSLELNLIKENDKFIDVSDLNNPIVVNDRNHVDRYIENKYLQNKNTN